MRQLRCDADGGGCCGGDCADDAAGIDDDGRNAVTFQAST